MDEASKKAIEELVDLLKSPRPDIRLAGVQVSSLCSLAWLVQLVGLGLGLGLGLMLGLGVNVRVGR